MALTTTTGSITDLVLLGDKSYTAKKFTLKEIAGPNSPYLEGGLYKEGIQDDEITFKVDYELSVWYSNVRQELSQGMIIRKDGTVVTGLTLEYHNQHLNSGNLKAPNWLFFKDTDGFKYEMCTTPHHSTNATNSKPGGCFGLPMASGAAYSHAEQTIWRKDNQDIPTPFYFQTNNPDVMAVGFSFVVVYDTNWNSSMDSYSYEPKQLKIFNEVMYNHDGGSLGASAPIFKANEEYTDIKKVRWRSRYFTVQSVNTETNDIEYKSYKTWMSNDLNLIKNQGIDFKIYLKGDISGIMKEFTLAEVIDKGRTDGTYNEMENISYTLELVAIQKWNTANTGEILWSGAAIISEDGQILGPYTFNRKAKVSPETGVYELIVGTYPNTTGMTSYVYIDSNRTTQTEPVAFGRQFHKSVSTYTGGNTSGKICSFLNINVTGGVDNDLLIKMYFEKPIKALLLDTVSVYDILYNGIDYATSRHTGYLKSITHDVELFNIDTFKEWRTKWIITVNNIIYGPRTIFTPTETFVVFMKISGQTLKVFTPNMYLYHELTDEMIEYTLDELVDLYKNDRIYNGRYKYKIIPVINIPVKLERTFNTTDKLIGYDSIQLINKDTDTVIKEYNDLGYNLFYNTDKKLFDMLSTGKDVINSVREDGVYLLKNTKVYSEQAVLNNLRSDEPNIKRIAVIPWGSTFPGFNFFSSSLVKIRVYSETESTDTLSCVSLGLGTGTEILFKDGSIVTPSMMTSNSDVLTDDENDKYRNITFNNGKVIRLYWTGEELNTDSNLVTDMFNSNSDTGYLPAVGTKEVTYWFKGEDTASEIEDVRLTLRASNYGYANNIEILDSNNYVLAKIENITKDNANTTETWYKSGIINLNTNYKNSNTGLLTRPLDRIINRYDYYIPSGSRGQVKWAWRQKPIDFVDPWTIQDTDDLYVPIKFINFGNHALTSSRDPRNRYNFGAIWVPAKYFKENTVLQNIVLFSTGSSQYWDGGSASVSYNNNPTRPGGAYSITNIIDIPDTLKLTSEEVEALWNTTKEMNYTTDLTSPDVRNTTKKWDKWCKVTQLELKNKYGVYIPLTDIAITQELVYCTVWQADPYYYNSHNGDMWFISGSGYGCTLTGGNSISVFTYGTKIGRICNFQVTRDSSGVSNGDLFIYDDKKRLVCTMTGGSSTTARNFAV